ncbi:SAM-dependent methyltransferase [Gracilibacillus boraciitolerans JCM 21714]|uniref:SAM-dependent methyltransferase n=1 Tax=Gracilibacillus boraciitolerans JCM 21714 TaxID=1298598 RepID=W4VMT5_9BACI|nr:SAM-dependent methyltransferase [Gracilibacillus boraciitolerans JCM 21714]
MKRFTNDFKGRQIQLKYVGDGHVVLPLDDAMEFLYTYTWGGEDAYDREVKEQFGIMTLHEYLLYLKSLLKGAHILKHENYLQEGYHYFLSKKIDFTDAVDNRNIRLPDSKAMFVIEKTID